MRRLREGHAGATELRGFRGGPADAALDHFSHHISKLGGERRRGLAVTRPRVARPRGRGARVDFGRSFRNDPRRLVGGGRAGRRSPDPLHASRRARPALLRREESALKLEELLLGIRPADARQLRHARTSI